MWLGSQWERFYKAFNLSVFVDAVRKVLFYTVFISEGWVAGVVPVYDVTASPVWIINDPVFVFTPGLFNVLCSPEKPAVNWMGLKISSRLASENQSLSRWVKRELINLILKYSSAFLNSANTLHELLPLCVSDKLCWFDWIWRVGNRIISYCMFFTAFIFRQFCWIKHLLVRSWHSTDQLEGFVCLIHTSCLHHIFYVSCKWNAYLCCVV